MAKISMTKPTRCLLAREVSEFWALRACGRLARGRCCPAADVFEDAAHRAVDGPRARTKRDERRSAHSSDSVRSTRLALISADDAKLREPLSKSGVAAGLAEAAGTNADI